MKTLIILTFAAVVSVGSFSLATERADAQSRSKTECTVREGVEFYRQRNYGQALRCWEETARHGNSAAQFNIARMYALGEGVPYNKMEAFKWMTIASRAGRPEATKVLPGLKKQMSPEEIADAEGRIRRFYTEGRR
ncbi:MAG: sel1 repeat family protein [Alphaproteobacteria bacterium]|jgi:TPR repeat protein|nr:sel1 repeat family protein [Alphaproteobacteria bacterium]